YLNVILLLILYYLIVNIHYEMLNVGGKKLKNYLNVILLLILHYLIVDIYYKISNVGKVKFGKNKLKIYLNVIFLLILHYLVDIYQKMLNVGIIKVKDHSNVKNKLQKICHVVNILQIFRYIYNNCNIYVF